MKFSSILLVTSLFAGITNTAIGGDISAGEKVAQNCVLCHGQYGVANMAGTPSLAGQPEVYLASQLKQFREGKRQNAVMSMVAANLSDADIDNVSAWFAQFEIELKKR